MFTIKIENVRNNVLTLTQNESYYQVINVDGLNPPKAQINSSRVAGLDGSKFNSSKLEERNIVIYIRLNGNVEANRIYLYSFFRTKEWCKFYYKNGLRDVFIEGYVESCEVALFTNNEIMQVSIICPNPYFQNINEIVDDISKALSAFKFPFAINSPIPFSTLSLDRVTTVFNDSSSENGMTIHIEIFGNVNKIRIVNVGSGEWFTVRGSFIANDSIVINTNKGDKSIRLFRNAVESNIFTGIQKGSTFFQLQAGNNSFSYLADDGASDDIVHIEFRHRDMYRGV